MTGRIVKYSEPVPFHKFTPAVAITAKPKNPTKAKARLARNVAIDDEDGFLLSCKIQPSSAAPEASRLTSQT
jgi:hypothetical protein